YRNAQVTVIAPTGTIGLLMDCDTTGVEPDFALVKFKKLAGGGYFKIANNSLRPALEALNYDDKQVRDILTYVMGSLSLDIPMPSVKGDDLAMSFADWLREAGMNSDDLKRIADALPGVFEVGFAFNTWTLGDEALKRCGIDPLKAQSNPQFNLLKHLKLTPAQIEILNERVCGTQTIEGAPHLKDEHLPVFDCANECGKKGKRFISASGHIRMMAAAQPFITGAISKTINLPNSASIDDIKSAYRLSWELGLKANALYRDGCKLSQPLSTKSSDSSGDDRDTSVASTELRLLTGEDEDEDDIAAAKREVAEEVRQVVANAANGDEVEATRVTERIVHRPMRRRLPDTRRSITHKFNIAGHEGYLTLGLYEDGRPGELFITMAKEGSTIGGLMDSLGTAVSVALQYGVPVESLVKKFAHQRFEPAGMTTNKDIPFAKSLVDYIFRWMGMQFIDGYREATAPRRGGAADKPAPTTDRPAPRRTETEARAHLQEVRSAIVIESKTEETRITSGAVTQAKSALSVAMLDCQGDAPACEVCGTITVRNGTCYRCLNCGHSMGCS
ncbi:MAG: vitamin B12-dependent ribonucleotide reductase, partial [Phycisphaerales bacterium]|nr:vitamin B12-dependent ribonucleotide reductase [Phycisphaerales bacterium]